MRGLGRRHGLEIDGGGEAEAARGAPRAGRERGRGVVVDVFQVIEIEGEGGGVIEDFGAVAAEEADERVAGGPEFLDG